MKGASEATLTEPLQIWFAEVPTQFDAALQHAYLSLLSTAEHAQRDRLRFDALKRRYLLTRALVRTALSQRVPIIAPAEWRFAQNAYGRPFIADPPDPAGRLRFNVSHTDTLVVMVLASGCEVGIDVECTQRPAPLDVAQRFFSRTESADLAGLPPQHQAARFWDLWTLKESYIKARGMGLSLPLDAFTFHVGDARVSMQVEPRLEDPGSGWHFWQFALPGDHLMALCAQKIGPLAPHCEFRRVLPLRDEVPLALTAHRVSRPQSVRVFRAFPSGAPKGA
jgi:4'-phosphopantetheinyl transferase